MGTKKKKEKRPAGRWRVHLTVTHEYEFEVDAADWSTARQAGEQVAMSEIEPPVAIRRECHPIAHLDGKLRAYMFDLHGPGDVMLVHAPYGMKYDVAAVTKVIETARVGVRETWNDGCEKMSVRVVKRPSVEKVVKLNELLGRMRLEERKQR